MRVLIIALLAAISYAQTVYGLQRPRQQSPRHSFPWDAIKSLVDQMAEQQQQNQNQNPRYVGEGGDNYYHPGSPQPYYYGGEAPEMPEPEVPERGDYYGYGRRPGQFGPQNQNQWGAQNQPQSFNQFGGNGGPSRGQGGQVPHWNAPSPAQPKRAPSALLTTPCGIHPTPMECMQEESCTWTQNPQFSACVGEGTPCEFLPQAKLCAAIAELGDAQCQWDMQGRYCFGETTPCHKFFSQAGCAQSAQECEWSMQGNMCWTETTPCPALSKPIMCGLSEDCHWDQMSNSCMMGEGLELMSVKKDATVTSESKSTSNFPHLALISLAGLVFGVLFGIGCAYGRRRKTDPLDVYQSADA